MDEYSTLLSVGRGKTSPLLDIVLTCSEMGWDYHTYMAQPRWFIDTLRLVKNMDVQYKNAAARAVKPH